MTYCGEHTLVKLRPERREATTLLCRSWLCETCAPKRRAQLIAQCHRGRANTFITLTSRRGSFNHPNRAAAELAAAWRIIRKRAFREAARDRKKNPRPFGATPRAGWGPTPKGGFKPQVTLLNGRLEFIAVFEATKLGWPHLHILTRSAWVAQAWLSAQMDELTASPVVYVQRITKRSQINAYIAKYAGKATHKFGDAKRYWQSKLYQLTRYEKPASLIKDWHTIERMKEDLHKIMERWQMHGYTVTWESTWHLVAEQPS